MVADINPVSREFCSSCNYWEPVGFYTWMREENPKMRECKHLKRCERVYKISNHRQMALSDYQIADYRQKEGCMNIKIGDKVVMNDKYHVADKNRGVEFTIRSEPFDLCGTVCVLLENYRGGYALDGLTKVN